jgi:hypothetical protein
MAMGLVKGEGFAVDASVLEANASRYHGKPPAQPVSGDPSVSQASDLDPAASSRFRRCSHPLGEARLHAEGSQA